MYEFDLEKSIEMNVGSNPACYCALLPNVRNKTFDSFFTVVAIVIKTLACMYVDVHVCR